jgi:hypothetical protein
MAYSVTPLSGIDLNSIVQARVEVIGSTTVTVPSIGPLGLEVFGSDGKLYVLAQANASITASTATCTVNASTFLVTATGGSYTSPAVDLVSGNVAWFSKASV